jgi:hypothetical protein
MTDSSSNGRTHEPSLRELTTDLDGTKELLIEKINRMKEVMEERDRLYNQAFKAAETAVSAALAAQEKSTSAAFAASEKAVLKAENAQADYNSRSNEFRGQLDDQAKTLMPRLEVNTMMRGMEEKVEGLKTTQKSDIARVDADIRSLRESRSEVAGKGQGSSATWAIVLVLGTWVGSAIMALALHFWK